MKIFFNFIFLLLARGSQLFIPLIVTPHLIQVLGINAFGEISFALSFCLYFGSIIQFGFDVSSTRDIARSYLTDQCSLAVIFNKTLFSALFLSIILFPVLQILETLLKFDQDIRTLCNLMYFYTAFQSLNPIWFFQGIEKMEIITIMRLFTALLTISGTLFFVQSSSDILVYPFIVAMLSGFSFFIALLIIRFHHKVAIKYPGNISILSNLASSKNEFLMQFMPNLYNNSLTFFLGIFSVDFVAAGLYAAGKKTVDLAISIGMLINSSFYPSLSRNISNHRRLVLIMSIASLSLLVFFNLFA